MISVQRYQPSLAWPTVRRPFNRPKNRTAEVAECRARRLRLHHYAKTIRNYGGSAQRYRPLLADRSARLRDQPINKRPPFQRLNARRRIAIEMCNLQSASKRRHRCLSAVCPLSVCMFVCLFVVMFRDAYAIIGWKRQRQRIRTDTVLSDVSTYSTSLRLYYRRHWTGQSQRCNRERARASGCLPHLILIFCHYPNRN